MQSITYPFIDAIHAAPCRQTKLAVVRAARIFERGVQAVSELGMDRTDDYKYWQRTTARSGLQDIGADGCCAVGVFAVPGEDRVVKVVRQGDAWLALMAWQQVNQHPLLPAVYGIAQSRIDPDLWGVLLERGGAPKDSGFEWDDPHNDWRYTVDTTHHGQAFMSLWDGELRDYMREHCNDPGPDLHSGNIMFRRDGSPMWIDPVYDLVYDPQD